MALHPLSYLDGYALKRLLKESKGDEVIHEALASNPEAWIDSKKVNRYKLVVGHNDGDETPQICGNARFEQVLDECVGVVGPKLLWIPPSLPYYPTGGPFQEAVGFSKVLVFSAWVMVPRMIASLLSYEVERATIGNPATRAWGGTGGPDATSRQLRNSTTNGIRRPYWSSAQREEIPRLHRV